MGRILYLYFYAFRRTRRQAAYSNQNLQSLLSQERVILEVLILLLMSAINL